MTDAQLPPSYAFALVLRWPRVLSTFVGCFEHCISLLLCLPPKTFHAFYALCSGIFLTIFRSVCFYCVGAMHTFKGYRRLEVGRWEVSREAEA